MITLLKKWFNRTDIPIINETKVAYCRRCKKRTDITDFEINNIPVGGKGFRKQIRGTCTVCENKVTTFI